MIHSEQYRDPESMGSKVEYGAEEHPSQGTAEYSTGEDPSPGYGGRQTEPGAYQTEDDPSHGAGGYSTGQDPSGSSGGTAARMTGHPDSTTGSDAGGDWEDR